MGTPPPPPIILTGTFNLVSGHATLFTLPFRSMCSFRLDKVSKLFIYGFNKEKLLEINALRRLKILFQRPCSSKSSGVHAPGPSSSSRLQRF